MPGLRTRLAEPLPLLAAALLLALLALGSARLLAAPGAPAALVLLHGLRAAFWAGLGGWIGRGAPAGDAHRRGLLPLALGLGLGTAALAGFAGRFQGPALEALPEPAALGGVGLVALVLVALLLGPLGEELLFRGALLDGLRRAHGPRLALWGSAGCFALLHAGAAHALAAFAAGLAMAWLRLRGGRLWPCVLAHAVHNALWLLGGLLAAR